MYTMIYDVTVGKYNIGMLDNIEIHKSVELLSDVAKIVLPGAQYNVALDVENQLNRGDLVSIKFGYSETGLKEEFNGYLRKISTDDGSITLECEDDLFIFRKNIANAQLKKITLENLLKHIVTALKLNISIACSYKWTYAKFVINNATGYDVLKKVQEECGADIYIKEGVLHIHPPGEKIGVERYYDYAYNIEESDLTYRNEEDKKVMIVVKANMPDGTVREIKRGSTGGEQIEIKCATSDVASMKLRGDAELKRRSFSGYDGSITGWLIPECNPSDSVNINDTDYPRKNGCYFVQSVTTNFSEAGGKRKIELGFRLS